MSFQFTATLNALHKGVSSISPDAAIKRLQAWEDALQDVELPGARVIRAISEL